MRIAHFLARCGVASRRKAEELVTGGLVTLNGEVIRDLGRQVDPERDDVRFDGKRLRLATEHVTLALNKPPKVMVSRGDTHGRRTVYDLLPAEHRSLAGRLVYVGRLDYTSEGLLVMTTDGDFANQLAHPSHHAEKEYHVWTDRRLTPYEVASLRKGVELDDGPAAAVSAEPLPAGNENIYRIILLEGRKRQVRRMIESLGAAVTRLVRVRIGGYFLGDLALGSWKRLGTEEQRQLLISANIRNKRVDRDKPPARKRPQ